MPAPRRLQNLLRPRGLRMLRSVNRGVKCDAVAFRIDDDRAKSVLADLLPRPQDLSPVGAGCFDCFIEPAFNQQIDQRAIRRRSIIHSATVAPNAKTTGRV